MNRRTSRRDIEQLIGNIRRSIKGVCLRTSIIVGFPGETEKEFKELLGFIKDTRFERMGAFIYSREEDTPACKFSGQIDERIKRERFDRLMSLQQDISKEVNEKFLHKYIEVLIEERQKGKKASYIGRTQYDAPEVDGQVYVRSKKTLKPGEFVNAKVTGILDYDLIATI
jgi:ribosomal protein S12 methylthiotransferase